MSARGLEESTPHGEVSLLPAYATTLAGQRSRVAQIGAGPQPGATTRSGGVQRRHPAGTASLARAAAAEALNQLREQISDGGRRYETFYTWLQLRSIADRTGLARGTLRALATNLQLDRHTLARHVQD